MRQAEQLLYSALLFVCQMLRKVHRVSDMQVAMAMTIVK